MFDIKVQEIFPEAESVDQAIPERAREYLRQSMESAPAGAVMLAASAVDSMLKEKGYKNRFLHFCLKTLTEYYASDDLQNWCDY